MEKISWAFLTIRICYFHNLPSIISSIFFTQEYEFRNFSHSTFTWKSSINSSNLCSLKQNISKHHTYIYVIWVYMYAFIVVGFFFVLGGIISRNFFGNRISHRFSHFICHLSYVLSYTAAYIKLWDSLKTQGFMQHGDSSFTERKLESLINTINFWRSNHNSLHSVFQLKFSTLRLRKTLDP